MVFEGIDGSGKGTLISGVKKLLLAQGFPEEKILFTAEPTKGFYGKKVRELLKSEVNPDVNAKQFLDLYKGGQRLFSNCLMQFFDIADANFQDTIFRNCKFMFPVFRNCCFKTCTFEQCTVYSGSFYTGRADDMIFDRCDIELTLFDNYQFFKSAIKKSNLRWFGMISSPGLDISSSSQFKVITDPSNLSAAEIEELTRMVMGTVERLDVGLRLKLKEIIRQDLNRYNLAQPEEKKMGG